MSKIKTITATTTEQTITFDATYQFVWFRSLGDGDVLVSDHSGIVAGTDDVALVKGGDSTRITVPYNKTVYIKAVSDSVDMEIHAQNFSDAPFEGGSGGSGGGESITIDPTPTQGSSNAVSSGGVYTALQGVSPIDYSTTEQNTGKKWIDGKPIYQISTLASGSDLFDVNTLSIDKLIKVEALGSDYSGYDGNKWTIEGVSSDSSRLIYWNSSSGKITYAGSYPIYVATIWYTKTTDTAE